MWKDSTEYRKDGISLELLLFPSWQFSESLDLSCRFPNYYLTTIKNKHMPIVDETKNPDEREVSSMDVEL